MLPRRSPGVVIATAGMQADSRTLHKTLQAKAVQYQFAHQRPINVGAAAQMLSNTLYNKRFFPYYTSNLCVGLDPQGECYSRELFTGRDLHNTADNVMMPVSDAYTCH